MWQSVKIWNVFNILYLKQIFWKTKNFFKKLEYYFLVERTNIDKASVPCKIAISEANVKTNRQIEWWVQNGPTTKTVVLPVATLFFLKILFQFKNLLQRVDLIYQPTKYPYVDLMYQPTKYPYVDLMYQPTKYPYSYCKRLSGCFSLWLSLIQVFLEKCWRIYSNL